MSQTAIEKEVCKTCAADVRPQADFCYNCGGAVSVSAVAKKASAESGGEVSVQKAAVENNAKPELIKAADGEEKQISNQETKLKTAASLRRKSKSIEKKTVEIVWEEHENAPNVLFIAVAVVLALAAAGILFLAMYLK